MLASFLGVFLGVSFLGVSFLGVSFLGVSFSFSPLCLLSTPILMGMQDHEDGFLNAASGTHQPRQRLLARRWHCPLFYGPMVKVNWETSFIPKCRSKMKCK
jgi:hypothetical protein